MLNLEAFQNIALHNLGYEFRVDTLVALLLCRVVSHRMAAHKLCEESRFVDFVEVDEALELRVVDQKCRANAVAHRLCHRGGDSALGVDLVCHVALGYRGRGWERVEQRELARHAGTALGRVAHVAAREARRRVALCRALSVVVNNLVGAFNVAVAASLRCDPGEHGFRGRRGRKGWGGWGGRLRGRGRR